MKKSISKQELPKNVKNVYICYGKEEIANLYSDFISKNYFKDLSFKKVCLDYNEIGEKELLEELLSFDLFAKHHYFVIKGLGKGTTDFLSCFIGSLSKFTSNLYIIYSEELYDENSKVVKILKKQGLVQNFNLPFDIYGNIDDDKYKNLLMDVKKRLKNYGVLVENYDIASSMFAYYCGYNLAFIEQEILKVSYYVDPKDKKLSFDEISNILPDGYYSNKYKVIEYLYKGDFDNAYKMSFVLISNNTATEGEIVGLMVNRIRWLCLVKDFLYCDGYDAIVNCINQNITSLLGDKESFSTVFKSNPMFVMYLLPLCKKLNCSELNNVYDKLYDIYENMKRLPLLKTYGLLEAFNIWKGLIV